MSKVMTADQSLATAPEDAELQSEIRAMFARMEELDIKIKQDQADIDRLKAETRAVLKAIKATGTRAE